MLHLLDPFFSNKGSFINIYGRSHWERTLDLTSGMISEDLAIFQRMESRNGSYFRRRYSISDAEPQPIWRGESAVTGAFTPRCNPRFCYKINVFRVSY